MRVERRTVRRLWRGWLVLATLTLAWSGVAVAGAAWRAMAAHPRVVRAVPPPVGPASVVTAEPVLAPVAALPGATGTIALPAQLPVPAAAAQAMVAAETGVVPARPFALGRATALDRSRALQCLADAVYHEAASEPDAGQRAVAQVVLNRVRHPAFPATVCGVVYQGSASAGCQFSFACDGSMARVPSRAGYARAERVAAAALAGYVAAPVGLATHYHTYRVTPAWNRALVMTDAIGAHFFHRWKGFWGTSAAFRQVYAGGEPLPGPHAAAVTAPPAIIATMLPTGPQPASLPLPPQAAIEYPAPAATDDRLPPAATILPKWRDTGKPL